MCPNDLEIQEYEFVIDVLFIDMVFPLDCEVTVDPVSRSFEKVYRASDNITGIFNSLYTIHQSIPRSWTILFYKCIILRDALCNRSLPRGQRRSILSEIGISGQTDQFVTTGCAFAIIANDLAASTDRMERIISLFRNFLRTNLKVADELVSFLVKLVPKFGDISLKEVNGTFMKTILDFLSDSPHERSPKASCFQITGSLTIPEFLYVSYWTILDSDIGLRIIFLQSCLPLLSSTDGKVIFLDFLRLLTNPALIHGILVEDLSQLNFVYFDIIKVVDLNLSKLWRLKSLIYSHEQQFLFTTEIKEEGEEVSDGSVMDDSMALNFLYWQHMRTLELDSKTQFYQRNYNHQDSVLLFPSILDPPPSLLRERQYLTRLMVQNWNRLLMDMESEWFWKLFVETLKFQYPSEISRMLDHVLSSFVILHPQTSLSYWIALLDSSRLYQCEEPPLKAIIDHFREKQVCTQTVSLTEEFQFLQALSLQIIEAIGPDRINSVLTRVTAAKIEKLEDLFSEITAGNSRILTLMELLLACLDLCTSELQRAFLSSKLQEKTQYLGPESLEGHVGPNVYLEEMMIMLAVRPNRSSIVELILGHYLRAQRSRFNFWDSTSTISHLRLKFVETHLNQLPFSQRRRALLEGLLGTKVDDGFEDSNVVAIHENV
jgi:hypothetical protein